MGRLEALGIPWDGEPIFELALTHRSYAYEQSPEPLDNERLEWLGDAILDAVVTGLLFTRHPDLSEGDLTRLRASLVDELTLAEIARGLDLGNHIKLGKGEEGSGGREKPSLLSNTFEALVGAVYDRYGFDKVTEIFVPLFEPILEQRLAAGAILSPKNALQEIAARERGVFPEYHCAASGPEHERWFTAHAYVDGELYGVGEGRSKKEAEQNAARAALERIAPDPTPAPGRGPDARAS